METSQLSRFIVFGSFVTAKPSPNDVDIFLLGEDSFDSAQLRGATRLYSIMRLRSASWRQRVLAPPVGFAS